jgi:pyruvate dehydrogenase E2 component (dihydrolipoamide acetyltransferase)
VARKLAQDKGIDLTAIRGTGPDGRIVQRDVETVIAGASAKAAETAPAAVPGTQVVPMSRMRQAIARRMTQSKQQAPHYYITVDIDMTEAEHERHEINNTFKRSELHLFPNDMVVKACAKALARFPMFNSWFVDGQILQHQAINICVAIALDDGLIAPAILDCHNKTLAEIAHGARSLAERTKSGALTPDEYTAGTFTVSTLGLYEVETLIAIIQPPQTAILGAGSVRDAPVVRDGQIVVGKVMKAALSADHRVTDGAQGARFLSEIRKLLENPAGLLID